MGGDAGEVDAAGAVLDEDQRVQAPQRHGVEVQEVGGGDAVGLGGQELPPGWAGALRGGFDVGGVEDLPDRGWGDRVAEAGEFALYPAVAPAAVLPGQAQDELLDGGRCGGSAGAAVPGERPLPGDESPVPGQQCGGGDREGLAPALARDQPRERGEPDPVGGLVADPGDLTPQHCVLVPRREKLYVLATRLRRMAAGTVIRVRTSAVTVDSGIEGSSQMLCGPVFWAGNCQSGPESCFRAAQAERCAGS